MSEYQIADRKDSRALTAFLQKEGQFLLPRMVKVFSRTQMESWTELGNAGSAGF
jgi:hypothetical protein